MITFWGRLSSINGRKVEWALREVGVPYQRVDTGREFGGIDTPDFIARNPNKLIPVIKIVELSPVRSPSRAGSGKRGLTSIGGRA